MVKKTAWKKTKRREIFHSLGRYLAILAIVALGVGFFAGVKVTRRAMVATGDQYVRAHHLYDYRLISTLGLTQEDVAAFAALDGIENAQGAYAQDAICEVDGGSEVILAVQSLTPGINTPALTAGRIPEQGDEILLDGRYFSADLIGQQITLAGQNPQDTLDWFRYPRYTVVGLCDSVLYLNVERGATSLGDGKVDGFAFLPPEGFDSEAFSSVYLTLSGEPDEIFSDGYQDAVDAEKDRVTAFLEDRAALRYQTLYADAQSEIDDGQREWNDGWADYQQGLADYQQERADAQAELDDAWQELLDGKQALEDAEAELYDGRIEIRDGWADYRQGLQEYQDGLKEYQDGLKEFEDQKKEAEDQFDDIFNQLASGEQALDEGKEQIAQAQAQVDETRASLEGSQQELDQYQSLLNMLRSLPPSMLPPELSALPDAGREAYFQSAQDQLDASQAQLNAGLAELEAGQQEIDKNRLEIDQASGLLAGSYHEAATAEVEVNQQLRDAQAELDDAKAQLDDAKAELDDAYQELTDAQAQWDDGFWEYAQAKQDYEQGLLDYQDAEKEANEAFADAEAELASAYDELTDGKQELDDARLELADLQPADTYVLTRMENVGYACFDSDSAIVDGVAKIFPVFFFLVAALVCTTTMSRMVDEQRTQIGTFKALGYSDGNIIFKYVNYAGSAALLGAVGGFFAGSWLFPTAIWTAYGMLYGFAPIVFVFDLPLALLSLAGALACSVGATYFSCRQELRQMPAQLMRPKAPQAGKRVFLEKIGPLWRHLSFLRKVSLRNIFRYKKRLAMMLMGIGGCTALMLAAMGIGDSISNIADEQFDEISRYDFQIDFSDEQDAAAQAAFLSDNEALLSQCVFLTAGTMDVPVPGGVKTANVVATDDPDITNLADLHRNGQRVPYPGFGQVAVSEKLAEFAGVEVGDTLTVRVNDYEERQLTVSGIFENHIYHYLYMTEETYRDLTGSGAYKSAYAATDQADKHAVAAALRNDSRVMSVSVSQELRDRVDNMMVSMNAIVYLVILSAGALALVVLYNLSNINITERVREIATIKVLGFYPSETGAYVMRENLVLTCMGALLGLPAGVLLHRYIMAQINIDLVAFNFRILPASFLWAVGLTFALTLLVDLLLRRKIERINMAESLKSVE